MIAKELEIDKCSDSELLYMIKMGDEKALEELYRRYYSIVKGLALKILRNDEEANEVVQTVFIQVWDEAHKYSTDKGSVFSWIMLIARSRAIDRFRVLKRKFATELYEIPSCYEVESENEQTVLYSQQRKIVLNALEALPTIQREVLELAYFEGLSQSQIAKKLDIPLGTVKTRTLHALRKLRKILGGCKAEILG